MSAGYFFNRLNMNSVDFHSIYHSKIGTQIHNQHVAVGFDGNSVKQIIQNHLGHTKGT